MINQIEKQFDRELDQLERDRMDGIISNDEYSKQVRILNRELADAARESAQDAYDNELERWQS